ncbi:MAG UNVERIFIED_CONTAM: hypothetical protein LVR18_49715 [Planctomycetaceae bacterium]|jgi:hypothetical protein
MNHAERAAGYLPQIEASSPASQPTGTTPGSFSRAPRLAAGRSRCIDLLLPGYSRNAGSIREKTAWILCRLTGLCDRALSPLTRCLKRGSRRPDFSRVLSLSMLAWA